MEELLEPHDYSEGDPGRGDLAFWLGIKGKKKKKKVFHRGREHKRIRRKTHFMQYTILNLPRSRHSQMLALRDNCHMHNSWAARS